jgi:hypothetical protein
VTDRFAAAEGVANAVLYEGYVLYPYRASARKNQIRWTFGLLAPAAQVAAFPGEASTMRTELVLEARPSGRVEVRVRYLHVQTRTVWSAGVQVPSAEVDGEVWTSFDEAVERTVVGTVGVGDETVVDFDAPAGREEEFLGGDVRVLRERQAVRGRLRLALEPIEGPFGLHRLTAEITNETPWTLGDAGREELCRYSLAAVHTLAAVDDGRFLSVLDPPEFARAAIQACRSEGAFPVLISDDVVLSSPIVLYDRPAIAPESRGEMFDSTEIDEILALRVLTLTDEEKREARATDPKAAAIIDRCEAMGPEAFADLHGTFRSVELILPTPESEPLPWWEPAVDAAFDPFSDTVWLGSARVGKGSRVILRPALRADAQDLFVAGKAATVAGVFHDVDDDVHLAVTIDDDPGADLHQWHGRYLYFRPDEVEVVSP